MTGMWCVFGLIFVAWASSKTEPHGSLLAPEKKAASFRTFVSELHFGAERRVTHARLYSFLALDYMEFLQIRTMRASYWQFVGVCGHTGV